MVTRDVPGSEIGLRDVHVTRTRRGHWLYAVGLVDLLGNQWFWLAAANCSESGWVAYGEAGGSDGPPGRVDRASGAPAAVRG